MHASSENNELTVPSVKGEQSGLPSGKAPTVGIVAGRGTMPCLLAEAVAKAEGRAVIFAIDGEASEQSRAAAAATLRLGQFGALIKQLKRHHLRTVALVGGIARRPSPTSLRPDAGTLKHLPRIVEALRSGDDGLLRAVAALFEREGLELVGPLAIAPDLAVPSGVLTSPAGLKMPLPGLEKALEAARTIGQLDIGQGAVAVGGRVVALEGVEGTDAMLERVAELKRQGRIGRGGVLVKCAKPQQDMRLDVPTIGPDTAEIAARAGLEAVAVEAERTMLAGRMETLDAFKAHRLALIGIAGES